MSSPIEYYEKYYAEGGPYKLADWAHTSRVATICDLIIEHTPKGGQILDVGCGDMLLSTRLPDYGWQGIDINIDVAKGKAVKHDLESPPYPLEANSFDTIVCSEVMEHLFDPVKVTKEIRRLLKPNGTYIVSTPNFHWIDNYLEFFERIRTNLDQQWTLEHIRHYTIESHDQILKATGFKRVSFTGADAHFSPFLCQGRPALRSVVEKAIGAADPNWTVTDQVLGAMFPLHNHTIIITAKPEVQ